MYVLQSRIFLFLLAKESTDGGRKDTNTTGTSTVVYSYDVSMLYNNCNVQFLVATVVHYLR